MFRFMDKYGLYGLFRSLWLLCAGGVQSAVHTCLLSSALTPSLTSKESDTLASSLPVPCSSSAASLFGILKEQQDFLIIINLLAKISTRVAGCCASSTELSDHSL